MLGEAGGSSARGVSALKDPRFSGEVVDVQLDDVLADEHRDERAEREERAERDRGLASLAMPLRDDDGADANAGDQRDQDRRGDGAAEEQAHHAGELDIAHAHAAGIGERRDQQEAAGGGAGDQACKLARWVERGAEHEREHGAERGDLVGDDPVFEVNYGRGYDDQDQRDAQGDARQRVVCEHGADTQRRGAPLDERVARRDRLAAAAAVAAQQQPGEDRDVVVRPHRRVASGAVRGRRDDRLVPGQTVDHDVRNEPKIAPRTPANVIASIEV